MIKRLIQIFATVGIAATAACAPTASIPTEPVETTPALPLMAWEHRPEADSWTTATLTALETHGAPLLQSVPGDIDVWCPGYRTASEEDRAAFWAGVFSALARHESTWNPRAVGGGDRWFGLTQISPATARGYACEARTGSDLLNGAANLACAVRIAARTVLRDGVVASGRRGLAADWAPFLNSSKRSEMIAWTREQPFCATPAQ